MGLLSPQIMVGEAVVFCCQSRRNRGAAEATINAAGCNFNSFIRRAVRFIGRHVHVNICMGAHPCKGGGIQRLRGSTANVPLFPPQGSTPLASVPRPSSPTSCS